MTLAVILNVVSMTLLLILLAATMRLPFKLRSGEQVGGPSGTPRRWRARKGWRIAPSRGPRDATPGHRRRAVVQP